MCYGVFVVVLFMAISRYALRSITCGRRKANTASSGIMSGRRTANAATVRSILYKQKAAASGRYCDTARSVLRQRERNAGRWQRLTQQAKCFSHYCARGQGVNDAQSLHLRVRHRVASVHYVADCHLPFRTVEEGKSHSQLCRKKLRKNFAPLGDTPSSSRSSRKEIILSG